MIVTTFSYSRTAQPKQYESVKIEAQGMPGEGQTAAEAFTELVAFVDGQVDATVKSAQQPSVKTPRASKPDPTQGAKSTAPPLARKQQATQAQIASATSTPPVVTTITTPAMTSIPIGATATDPPFEPGQQIAAEPKPKKRGRPKKATTVPSVEELLPTAMLTKTVADLLIVFNNMRSVADRTKGEAVEQWVSVCVTLHKHMLSMPGHETQDGYEEIGKAFDAEKEAIVLARNS